MAGEALSNGAKLEVQSSAGPPIVYTLVGGVQGVEPPSPDTPDVDVTALDSEGQETIPGLPDYGETSFSLFLRGTGSALVTNQALLQTLATSRAVVSFKVTGPTGIATVYTCNGWVKAFRPNYQTGQAAVAAVTIRWTGKPVIS